MKIQIDRCVEVDLADIYMEMDRSEKLDMLKWITEDGVREQPQPFSATDIIDASMEDAAVKLAVIVWLRSDGYTVEHSDYAN